MHESLRASRGGLYALSTTINSSSCHPFVLPYRTSALYAYCFSTLTRLYTVLARTDASCKRCRRRALARSYEDVMGRVFGHEGMHCAAAASLTRST